MKTRMLLTILGAAVALLLTAANCGGTSDNKGCANKPEGCPLQTARQIAPVAALISIPPPSSMVTRSPLPSPTLSAKILLSIGDSLTVGTGGTEASYRGELSRLLRLTGQPHTWVVAAAGGSKCSYWLARIDALITQYQPNVIFLNCGTNDTPTDTTESDYRAMLTIAANRGVPVIASYIGRPYMGSPENSVRPYIEDWMEGTNSAIGRALATNPVPAAEVWRIPANPEWLQADGIHWKSRAEAAAGQLFYQKAAPVFGWKTLTQMGTYEMCGLSGVRRGQPWPTNYRVCTS